MVTRGYTRMALAALAVFAGRLHAAGSRFGPSVGDPAAVQQPGVASPPLTPQASPGVYTGPSTNCKLVTSFPVNFSPSDVGGQCLSDLPESVFKQMPATFAKDIKSSVWTELNASRRDLFYSQLFVPLIFDAKAWEALYQIMSSDKDRKENLPDISHSIAASFSSISNYATKPDIQLHFGRLFDAKAVAAMGDTIKYLKPGYVKGMPDNAFSLLKVEQFKLLDPKTFVALSAAQMESIPPKLFNALTLQQANELKKSKVAPLNVSIEQYEQWGPEPPPKPQPSGEGEEVNKVQLAKDQRAYDSKTRYHPCRATAEIKALLKSKSPDKYKALNERCADIGSGALSASISLVVLSVALVATFAII